MHVVLHSSGKAELRVLYPWKIPPPEYLSSPSAAATTTSSSELSEVFNRVNRVHRTLFYIGKSGEDNEVP